jgi:hypothetical protein
LDGASPSHPPCPPSPGSTNHPRRPAYRPARRILSHPA